MNARFDLTAWMALFLASMCFTEFVSAQTPFSFVQRDDVREEVNVNQTQINRVDQLQDDCDALCQQRMREQLSTMDQDLRRQFENLDTDQRTRALTALEDDIRETVELEALDEQVLNDPQMDRFNQLWTQQNGLDSLTCGPSSRALGLSDIQFSQIQNIRGAASAAMEACAQNSQFSAQQQFVQIQNIQFNLINQCIDVLSDDQVQQFADMCGEPFDADPTIDDDGSDNSVVDTEIQDTDVTTSVDNVGPTSSAPTSATQGSDSRNSNRTIRRRGSTTARR